MAADLRPTLADVYHAHRRTAAAVRITPLEHSETLSAAAGADIHLKLECWQRTRSFKLRGAYNAIALLTPEERSRGLVTASAGNHGQAVALAARELDARAVIFLPRDAPELKQQSIRRHGAELRTDAADYDEAESDAQAYALQTGAVFVHAFADRAVIAGQGTIALELLDALPALRTVVVPVGGGGLITGIGSVLKAISPEIRVIGVQSTETRAMYEAFHATRVVTVPVPPTLADGLAGCTDQAVYESAREVVDEMMLVEEQEIAAAMRSLYVDDGVVAEGAGATAAAAILSGRLAVEGPAALIISGGNVDAARLSQILAG